MKNFTFTYNGKSYPASLISSNEKDIQYYWVMLEGDDRFITSIGDTIAFHIENGTLMPTYRYTRLAAVVEELRCTVASLLHVA